MTRCIARAAALGLALAVSLGAFAPRGDLSVLAAEGVRELKWADLVPTAPAKPRGALAGRSMFNIGGDGPNRGTATADDPAPAPTADDARWMSAPAKRRSEGPPPIVAELDGQTVRIGGYVVPLDFDATTVKEFLLVPFVGACIHVPPPPPNQIVYVTSAKGIDIKGTFEPVYVTGQIKTAGQFTGLAETGYTLTADRVEARKE